MRARNFIIYTGYVESSSWGCLALRHSYGFESVEEALQHLGECILTGFKIEEENFYWAKCCRESQAKKIKFCDQCGQRVSFPELDIERLGRLIMDLQRSDMNGIPHEVWEMMDGNGWKLFGGPYMNSNTMANIVIIQDNGDRHIAQAAFGRLFDETPEHAEFMKSNYKTTPKDWVRREFSIPKGMKMFMDD